MASSESVLQVLCHGTAGVGLIVDAQEHSVHPMSGVSQASWSVQDVLYSMALTAYCTTYSTAWNGWMLSEEEEAQCMPANRSEVQTTSRLRLGNEHSSHQQLSTQALQIVSPTLHSYVALQRLA